MPYALVPRVPDPDGGSRFLPPEAQGNVVRLSLDLAVAWTPSEFRGPGAVTLCDAGEDFLAPQRRGLLQQLLPDRTLQPTQRFHDILGAMLKTPPPGTWRPLTPHIGRGQLEILLGPWTSPGNPGILWREAAEVRGPHSKDIQDNFSHDSGANLDGTTSSDAQFTWSVFVNAPSGGSVTNNGLARIKVERITNDNFGIALASLAMDTADHYSEAEDISIGTDCIAHVIVRQAGSTFGAYGSADATKFGTSGYSFATALPSNQYRFHDIPNDTNISTTPTTPGPGTMRLQISGSSYTCLFNGSPVLSGTDTVYAGGVGARRVGFGGQARTADVNDVVFDNFRAVDLGAGGTPASASAILTGVLVVPSVGTRLTVPTP